jgi:hypothetical protein
VQPVQLEVEVTATVLIVPGVDSDGIQISIFNVGSDANCVVRHRV